MTKDVNYMDKNYQFIYRVSAIIFNQDKTKVLLFYGNDRDFYMLPGGKVHELETSTEAIKREIREELGYTNLEYKLAGISEETANVKGINNHQITLTYKTIYSGNINEETFKSKESDWINFKWLNIKELDKYKIYPNGINDMIKSNSIYHLIDKNI